MPLVDYGDDSDDEDDSKAGKPFSMTHFLFGNVSESGALESDYLEEDAKEHLENLNTADLDCLGNQIRDVRLEVDEPDGPRPSSPKKERALSPVEREVAARFSPTAVDFSDFNEPLDDDDDYDGPVEPRTNSPKENSLISVSTETAQDTSDVEMEAVSTVVDGKVEKELEHRDDPRDESESMEKELETAAREARMDASMDSGIGSLGSNEDSPSVSDITSHEPSSAASNSSITERGIAVNGLEEDPTEKHLLNTPLASVLPPELANINVNDVFPDFKPDVVLRFSRLFGPGRPSSLPKRWVNFRKNSETSLPHSEDSASSDDDDDAILEKACREAWPVSKPVPNAPAENEAAVETDAAATVDKVEEVTETVKPKTLTSASIPPWRYGPAQYWYDSMDVDPTGENFDYGASEKRKDSRPCPSSLPFGKINVKLDVNEEAFLMVSLTNWERDIIWDGAKFKHETDKILAEKRTAAGWLPNTTYRTAAAFLSQSKSMTGQPTPLDLKHDSLFPAENDDLINGNWEKDIIWDANNVEDLPEPAVLMLDPNDPNIILSIPDEDEFESPMTKEPVSGGGKDAKDKKDMLKRSRMVLGKAGMLKEPMSPKSHENEPKNRHKDPFNLSNDEYYSPRVDEGNLKTTTGAVALQHSTPAVQLYQYFFPTTWGLAKLRQYHRNALKKYSNGQIIHPGPHPVKSLVKNIKKREKQREQEKVAAGGGEVFYMRIPEDLSVQDGEVVFVEYSEEHPPLIGQVGMATRVKNFWKRKPGKNDDENPVYDYGELTLAHTSPFLGNLGPGQSLQAMENNMFRAPIYQHKTPATDFLVIRTRNYYFIREIDVIFTAGQQCPLMEVPAPNSKKATNFARDYLTVHIYRLFWKSTETPKRVKTDDVKKLFAHTNETNVRKRLKMCADFQRSGAESHWWNLKPEFRLPSEEEIRALVTPEDYCAYHSMRSAEQRLKDAGYGGDKLEYVEDEGDDEQQSKMDDEIKAAPWNTTRAFIAAMKNKCILQLTGDADPTGRGEGFSYVKVPNKTEKDKDGPAPAKRIVTGTDADLRKLSLQNAKNLLRKFGVKEDKIKVLTRWEIIALVRTLGSQQAKTGAEESMSKFARGNRFSAAEQMEKYKEESQRIFDLQNRILASDEVLSTDEESSEEEEDAGLEEQGRDLDSFIQSKKTTQQLLFEQEEKTRKELKESMNQEEVAAKNMKNKLKNAAKSGEEPAEEAAPQPTRKLKIIRTFRDTAGNTFDRVEYVSRSALIDQYVRIREKNDAEFIQQFSTLDSEKKVEKRKAKRLKQEQLRRGKEGNDANPDAPPSPEPTPKKKYGKDPSQLKVRCGACGQVGHMRTNKAVCPMADEPPTMVMTKEREDQLFVNLASESGLVKVEGAKITLKKEVLNQSKQIRRESLIVKIPKLLADGGMDKAERKAYRKERREREEGEKPLGRPRKYPRTDVPDYLDKPRTATRRRVDPVVSLASELEVILNELRDLPKCELFRMPVSKKKCPDYALYVTEPMDLSTMRTKLNAGKYKTREEFLADVNQIVKNSEKYNGKNSDLTMEARQMLTICLQRFGAREEEFKRLEKQINPLLDDNDQVALSYLFQQIIQTRLRTIEGSTLFHQPVNVKKVANYYDVIKSPMDLETMEQKTVKSHQYQTAGQFLADVKLILTNCTRFNGPDSDFTRIAEDLYRVAQAAVAEETQRITLLEEAIRKTIDAAETESVGTHYSDSEPRTTHPRLGSVFSTSNMDIEDSDTHGPGRAPSELGDDETPRSPASEDVFIEESVSRNSASSPPPPPPLAKTHRRLSSSMAGAYHDDALTGYDDDQMSDVVVVAGDDDGGGGRGEDEPSTSRQPDDPMEGSSDTPSGPPAALTRISTLEDDLNVSDSESDDDENGRSPPKKSAGAGEDGKQDSTLDSDGEDDGLFF